jgi:hypothetical protein
MRAELGKVAGAGSGTPERYGLTVTQALPVEIAVGRTRAIENDGDTSGELSKRRYAPEHAAAPRQNGCGRGRAVSSERRTILGCVNSY